MIINIPIKHNINDIADVKYLFVYIFILIEECVITILIKINHKADVIEKYNGNKKWMLAGGLNHRNILEAIKKSNSKNIDVSSGVESSPGVKSKELINKFIHKIRSLKS